MAVNLLGASDARIDYGDTTVVDNATELTIAITVTPSNIANNERIVSKWGNLTTEQAFIWAIIDNDEILFAAQEFNAQYRQRKTSGLNLATGTTYRLVSTWRASDNRVEIWSNGVKQTMVDVVTNNVIAIDNVTTSLQVGHETDDAIDGIDGDYSEFALWTRVLVDDEIVSYGEGYSPDFFRRGGVLYSRMTNLTDLNDRWSGLTGTNTAGTAADHPRMFYPSRPQVGKLVTAVAAFDPATMPFTASSQPYQRRVRVVAY